MHTPTPWTAAIAKGSYQRPAFVKAGEKVIAECKGDQLNPQGASIGEATANAEFIARACNVHADLLAALKETLRIYVQMADSGDCGNWNPETEEHVIAARAAIAKAESK